MSINAQIIADLLPPDAKRFLGCFSDEPWHQRISSSSSLVRQGLVFHNGDGWVLTELGRRVRALVVPRATVMKGAAE